METQLRPLNLDISSGLFQNNYPQGSALGKAERLARQGKYQVALERLRPLLNQSLSARGLWARIEQQIKLTHSLISLNFLSVFYSSETKPFQEGDGPEALAHLKKKIQGGKDLREAFGNLNATDQKVLREKVGPKNLKAIFINSEIPTEKFFWRGTLSLGRRLKNQDRLSEAQGILGLLAQSPLKVPHKIRQAAKLEWDAMVGRGNFGYRLEFLASRFVKEATDYRMIVPMIAGSAIYQLAKTATLGRLVASPAQWWTRRWGARTVAAAVGFGVEVPTFSLLSQGLRAASGDPVGPMGQELAGAALTLGVLKGSGFLGKQFFHKLHRINEIGQATRLTGFSKASRFLYPQAAMFTGLMAAHKLEERLGWRPQVDGATTVMDTLASLVSLGVGSHLGHRALGRGFAKVQQKLGMSAEIYGQYADRNLNLGPPLSGISLEPGLAFAGEGKVTTREFPHIFLSEGEGSSGGENKKTAKEKK